MRVEVLVVELRVELLADPHVALVARCEDMREFETRGSWIRFALFRETFGSDDLSRRVLLRPGGQEDVVFEVGRDEVFDLTAHGGDFLLDGRGEGDGGEDGEGAGAKFDHGGAAADGEEAEAREGDGEGGDGSRDDVADGHDFGRVGGDEFGGGFGCHVGDGDGE